MIVILQEDITLPSVPSVDPLSNEVKALIASKIKLEYFWKGSCYNLQEGGSKSSKDRALDSLLHSLTIYHLKVNICFCLLHWKMCVIRSNIGYTKLISMPFVLYFDKLLLTNSNILQMQ